MQSIVETYQFRKDIDRYARKVSIEEIEKNGYNLNVSRYVSTSVDEVKINLKEVNERLLKIDQRIKEHILKHNEFLGKLGIPGI